MTKALRRAEFAVRLGCCYGRLLDLRQVLKSKSADSLDRMSLFESYTSSNYIQ